MRCKSLHFLLCGFILSGCGTTGEAPTTGVYLNDVHSRLNNTRLERVFYPSSTEDIVEIIKEAKKKKRAVSISGGRHAMGGQQFGVDTFHISMTKMDDVLSLDRDRGIVRVESGIGWPKLMEYLLAEQEGQPNSWTIVQKQTGADQLSIGGALSANAHGRGTHFKPMIQDVESFTLVNADGEVMNVSREENSDLFRLVIGGYGLFGVIATVDLRLQPRQKLQRVVEIISLDELPAKAKERLETGFLYGDFQYKTDETAEDFMKVGVLSAYKPVGDDTPIPQAQRALSPEEWYGLLHQAHVDKSKAFDLYAKHYLATNGQIYWNDTQQMSFYVDGYIEYLERVEPDFPKGSLMISELYVPRERLAEFINAVIGEVRENKLNVIYGTMRLIEKDDESFLAWAKRNYACVIFNLRVEHSEDGLKKAEEDFQRLIDRALALDGSYFLTYHRWARKDQVQRAYPQFVEFMKLKLKYDPQERFQSEWYRHYKWMFSEEIVSP